jgi:hypothetical protein
VRTYEVAGRTVTMPCVVRDATAATAMFEVDAAAVAGSGMVPGEFTVVETTPGRCQLVLAVIDYRDNDLGDYREVGVSDFVRPAGDQAAEPGTFIVHLPVDQEFTCEAGQLIWGFPKTVERIDLAVADGSLTAALVMDGTLAFRLTVPAGGSDEMPELPMVTYSMIDGVPHATGFVQGGAGSAVRPGPDGVTLELGEHPVGRELAALGLPAPAILSTWTEHMRGEFQFPAPIGAALP